MTLGRDDINTDPCKDANWLKMYDYLIGDVDDAAITAWGDLWVDCIEALAAVERAASFVPHGRLQAATTSRPKELADWMKHHRPLHHWPIINIEVFSKLWWGWWRANLPCVSSQPAFDPATEAAQFEDCDWSPLFVTGTSGILLFVVALAWWRSRLDVTGIVGETYSL